MEKFRANIGTPHRRTAAVALCAVLGLAGQIAPAGAGWKSVDVPGAYLTSPAAINDKDAIAGFYWQTNSDQDVHAFLRTPGGAFTTFDAPGANGHTIAEAVNANGVVAGWYTDSRNDDHGFVRDAEGTITTFDAQGDYDTWPLAIDEKGVIAGYFLGSNGYQAFLRTAAGKIRSFDVPKAADTNGYAINHGGAITGEFVDASGVPHGFLRAADGSLTKFNIPKVKDPLSLRPSGINANGEIAGSYESSLDYSFHGFVRDTGGTITVLSLGDGNQTGALGINGSGDLVGVYDNHGFVRTPDGQVTTLDFPGADHTTALSINRKGDVTGYYYSNSNGIFHGFLYKP